jgi:hypothetical protein
VRRCLFLPPNDLYQDQVHVRADPTPANKRGRIPALITPLGNRPSGETANGIPLAYPAISHQICLATVPEAPMLLRVVRQSNSAHRDKPVSRAGGAAWLPAQLDDGC